MKTLLEVVDEVAATLELVECASMATSAVAGRQGIPIQAVLHTACDRLRAISAAVDKIRAKLDAD